MEKCTNCDGEGIVGGGEKPWLRLGALSTCGVCGGSGKVGAENAVAEAPVAPAEEVPVDNSSAESFSDGSPEVSVGAPAIPDEAPVMEPEVVAPSE